MTMLNLYFRYPSTRIPLPESAKRSQNQRKRHLAGSQESSTNIHDLKDSRIQSRPVLQQQQNPSDIHSDMESSLGILSPTEILKSEFVSMSSSQMSNNNNNNNNQGWTSSNMTRSRTFTRELNDPKGKKK